MKLSKWRLGAELVALAAIFAAWSLPALLYGSLRSTVPVHYGAFGNIDKLGPKADIWILPVVASAMYVVLWLVTLLSPKFCNVPVRITDDNAHRQFALLRELVSLLKAVSVLTFVYIEWATIQSARGTGDSGLSPALLPASLAAIAACFALYLHRARSAA